MTAPAPETIEREKDKLLAERVRELFSYEPSTGKFTRLVGRGGEPAGVIAGTLNKLGYRIITIDRVQFLAHRLAWFWTFGHFPPEIDHINRNPDDNRIENLRLGTHAQNMANQAAHCDGSSGTKGVFPSKGGRWRARITKHGRSINLGTFNTKEAAHSAYCAAAKDMFGEFWRPE